MATHQLISVPTRDQGKEPAEANPFWEQFRIVFDQWTYFAGIMTLDGTVVEANRIFLDGCGFTRDQVIGKKFWNCGWWNGRADLMKIIEDGAHQAAEGPVFRTEMEYFMADGNGRFIDLTIAPARNDSGEITFLIPTGTDITDRKLAEEGLKDRARLAAIREELGNALIAGGTCRVVLQKCTEMLVRHLGAAFVRIWTLDEARGILELQASAGMYTHLDGAHGRIKVGEFKIGRIARNAQALLTNDVPHDPNISSPEWARREGMVAFAGYPMMLEGRVIGVMAMFSRRPFSETAFTELEPIAGSIAQWMSRKHTEEDLRQTKARLEATLVATEVATWTWDPQKDCVVADANLARMFGVSPEDAAGAPFKTYLDAIHPDDQVRIQKTLTEAMASESGHYEADFRVSPSEGVERWVVARGIVERDPEGRPIRFPGVIIEFTDRKRAEDALRASEERFRLLADNISQLAWMADAAGSLFWYNQRWFDYTGTTLEEMNGWGWEKVHHPDHLGRVVAKWKTHLEQGNYWEDTFPLRGKDGNYGWYLSRAFPIRDDSGRIVRWFGTNTDITDVRSAQEALKEAQNALAEQNQILDRTVQERTARLQETITELEAFSYSISHDMRSPLRAMQGYADALLQDYKGKLDAQGEQYLQRILRGANRLDLLIRDVLAYSKVAREQIQLQVIDLEALIRDIVQNYPNLHSSHLEVKILPLPKVWGHEGLLTQVVSNLLGNAVKFCRPGTPPRATISADTHEGKIRVWFEDNGLGIAPEHHKQIFEIFGRVYPESKFEGTGIGLAIVKKAVERMGGGVGLVSELGSGSRFWLTLKGVQ